MDMIPFREPIVLAGAYDSSPNPFRENSYIEGWNVLLRGTDGTPESWKGMGPQLVNLGSGVAVVEVADELVADTTGHTYVKQQKGGAANWRNRSLFYIGGGGVYYGSGTPFDTATDALRVRLSTGAFYVVGMAKPVGALTIDEAVAATTRGLQGVRAMCYTEVNTDTGWESNRSDSSNVWNYQNGKQAKIHFPVTRTNSNANGLYQYWTPEGLGGLGTVAPFYRLGGLIPLTGPGAPDGSGVKTVDFNDTDLAGQFQAPVTNNPPPGFPNPNTGAGDPPVSAHGTFVVGFDAIVVILATYGGSGISPSEPNNSGVFDPLNTIFSYVIERILAVWPRSAMGYALFATKSSLQALYPVGGRPGVAVRPLWSNSGIPGGHKSGKFCAESFLCYTDAGPAMLVGSRDEPAIAMNAPVRDEMRRNFDPGEVVVGWEPKDQMAVFCGKMRTGPLNGSWVAFPYRLGIGWGPKLVLDSQPADAVTFDANNSGTTGNFGPTMHILFSDGSLKPWNTQGGAGLLGGWLIRSGAITWGGRELWHKVRRVTTTGNASGITCKMYKNLDTTTPYATWTAGAGVPGKAKKCRVTRAKAIQVEFSGTLSGRQVWQTVALGSINPKMR